MLNSHATDDVMQPLSAASGQQLRVDTPPGRDVYCCAERAGASQAEQREAPIAAMPPDVFRAAPQKRRHILKILSF